MEENTKILAKEYYTLVGNKEIEGVKERLSEEVELHGPLAVLKGIDAVIKANKHFMSMFSSLQIRKIFSDTNEAMVVYDLNFPGISENFPGAAFLHFKDKLIVKIELFYDARSFVDKKDEIFS